MNEGRGVVKRALNRMEMTVMRNDRELCEARKAAALEGDKERVIEYFKHFDERRHKPDELVLVVKSFAGCARSLDLSDCSDDVEDIVDVLVRLLPRASDELAPVVIDALICLSYQEFEPLLYGISSEVYTNFTNFVLPGPWRDAFAKSVYMALYRMAIQSLRIRNAIIRFFPIDRLDSLIRESDADVHEKCYLLYALSSQRLSAEEARTCVKLIHFLFEHADQSVLEIAVYSMLNVMKRCVEVPSCFFSDDTLGVMMSRADGSDVISEYLLYVVGQAITKQNGKRVNVPVENVVEFLSSSNPQCQMAAVYCLRMILKYQRNLVPREGAEQLLGVVEAEYQNANMDTKVEFNKLVIDLFQVFDEASALDFILNRYMHVVVEMLQPIYFDGAKCVLVFCRDLLDAAAKNSMIERLWSVFEEQGMVDSMKELFAATESALPSDPVAGSIRDIINGIMSSYNHPPE